MERFLNCIVCIALIIAVIKYLLIPHLNLRRKYLHLKKHGTTAIGRIVDFEVSEDSDGLKYYSPIVEFETSRGFTRKTTSKFGRTSKKYFESNIKVFYNENDPSENFVESSDENPGWIFGLVMMIVGLGVAFYALLHFTGLV